MVAASDVLILGGYGTFGRHVARELTKRCLTVTIAGRSQERAQSLAQQLGCQATAVDLTQPSSLVGLVQRHAVVVQCMGPFGQLDAAVLQACLRGRCHYVDITDDRQYAQTVRDLHDRFADQQLTAAYGCSCLPSISGALALALHQQVASPLKHARCALFIGNRNRKGLGAVRSAAQVLGRTISAPQGALRGFLDREVVDWPQPLGRRAVFNFESPDYDLLPSLLEVHSMDVKVGFESSLANWLFHGFGRWAPGAGRWLIPRLTGVAWIASCYGISGGAVMAELTTAKEQTHSMTMMIQRGGQRMAVLPAVHVVEKLLRGGPCPRGAVTAYDVLGPAGLIDRLVADGCELRRASSA